MCKRFTQEQCAVQTNVSRTAVQRVCDGARKKPAQSLANGKALLIEGGKYRLCGGQGCDCGGIGCHRRLHGRHVENMDYKTEDFHENCNSNE